MARTSEEIEADPTPVTRGFLAGILHRVGVATSDSINRRIAAATAALATRLSAVESRTGALSMLLGKGDAAGRIAAFEALEARIAVLEARKYCGVFEQGREYSEGQSVTLSGSLWLCCGPTTDRPGTSEMWQLAVKKNRADR